MKTKKFTLLLLSILLLTVTNSFSGLIDDETLSIVKSIPQGVNRYDYFVFKYVDSLFQKHDQGLEELKKDCFRYGNDIFFQRGYQQGFEKAYPGSRLNCQTGELIFINAQEGVKSTIFASGWKTFKRVDEYTNGIVVEQFKDAYTNTIIFIIYDTLNLNKAKISLSLNGDKLVRQIIDFEMSSLKSDLSEIKNSQTVSSSFVNSVFTESKQAISAYNKAISLSRNKLISYLNAYLDSGEESFFTKIRKLFTDPNERAQFVQFIQKTNTKKSKKK